MIKLKKIHHRGKDRLGLFFSYDDTIISSIKELPYRRYSKSLKCWHLPYNNTNLNRVLDSGLEVDLGDLEDDILQPGLPSKITHFIEDKAHELIGTSRLSNNKISSATIDEMKLKIQNWQIPS